MRASNEEGSSGWSPSGEGKTIALLTVEMEATEEPPVSGAFGVRLSFSEEVTGFSAGDVDSSQDPACVDDQNNTVFCAPQISGLQTGDNRVFTARVTPQDRAGGPQLRVESACAGRHGDGSGKWPG